MEYEEEHRQVLRGRLEGKIDRLKKQQEVLIYIQIYIYIYISQGHLLIQMQSVLEGKNDRLKKQREVLIYIYIRTFAHSDAISAEGVL